MSEGDNRRRAPSTRPGRAEPPRREPAAAQRWAGGRGGTTTACWPGSRLAGSLARERHSGGSQPASLPQRVLYLLRSDCQSSREVQTRAIRLTSLSATISVRFVWFFAFCARLLSELSPSGGHSCKTCMQSALKTLRKSKIFKRKFGPVPRG